MPNKLGEAIELTKRHQSDVARSAGNWFEFLQNTSAHYKYPFEDKVLLHAYRPNATACAELPQWNKTFGRWIRKGSSGIPLVSYSDGAPRLRYVFDISDTQQSRYVPSEKYRPVELWRMTSEHEAPVMNMLNAVYGEEYKGETVREKLTAIVSDLTANDLDEGYANLIGTTALCIVLSRCGIDTSGMSEQFADIAYFEKPAAITELGGIASELADQILRQIERTVKTYNLEKSIAEERGDTYGNDEFERTRDSGTPGEQRPVRPKGRGEAESAGITRTADGRGDAEGDGARPEHGVEDGRYRDGLHEGGRLLDTGSVAAEAGDSTEREVRPNEADVSGEPQEVVIGEPPSGGDISSTLDGHRGDGEPEVGDDNGGNSQEEPSAGQGGQPDELGEAYEHYESSSGGDDTGADIRVSQIEEPAPDVSVVSTPEPPVDVQPEPEEPPYQVGDSVYLDDDRRYIIEEIHSFSKSVSLLDTSFIYPISRGLSKAEFERFYNANPKNFPNRQADINDTPFVLTPTPVIERIKPRQISIFASEEEQIGSIQAQALTYDDIGFALALGSGATGGKERIARICAEYAKTKDIADALKQEYGTGGRSLIYPDGVKGWLNYDWKKLTLSKGENEFVSLSWVQAANRITSLVLSGEYGAEFMPLSVFTINEPSEVIEDGKSNQEEEAGDAPESVSVEPEITEPVVEIPKLDYRIPDEPRDYGGSKTRYRNNVEAIKTLKAIEAEERAATAEEQKVLSLYIGWGGLPQAFDRNNDKWANEYAELQGLFTDEEYRSAMASTLNAHYTSPAVIDAMYKALGNMGLKGGKVLEPAVGVGNFFGRVPEEMSLTLYGIELDPITGRIAQQLYQTAQIQVSGFEKVYLPDNSYDAAVGNVPFGSYKLADPRYDSKNFLIHDYFFAKSLDLVRPGGVVAFVTSKGTLDKENPAVRRYLSQRAELLGAVRLPNNAFKDNAGTEVTTDVVFLQKRGRPIEFSPEDEPEWVHLNKTTDGVPVNQYFADNPDMVLGAMVYDRSMYGNENETACTPFEDSDLSELLRQAIGRIQGQITKRDIEAEEEPDWLPADPDVRNWSYTRVDGKIYYRQEYRMYPENLPVQEERRLHAILDLEDCVKRLITLQQYDSDDESIRKEQADLHELYDSFTKKYGLINERANAKAFNKDNAYYLLCSLEILDENGKFERKADIFDKRTIRRHTVPDSVDTPSEALTISLAEKARVDIPYISALTGMEKEKVIEDLRGVIFPNPQKKDREDYVYETADEYLSGAVREKLEVARIFAEREPETFSENVTALEKSQPIYLEAGEIDVRLGSTWIDKGYVQDFMYDLLETPRGNRNQITVEYSSFTSDWNITNKTYDWQNVRANSTYGTSRMSAYKIIENTLNLKDVRVYDTVTDENGSDHSVLNRRETAMAQLKQETVKEAFKDWIFRDPERRETLVSKYNLLFNSTRPREYDGSHISFPGMSPEIELREHQSNAIAHILYGGNTLLAHEVGAGKTYEMAAAAMESKRLGLCNKSLFVVPNHLTEQMASEFLRLYPAANILVAAKKDFETANRKKFCARVATGDYDAVIIGHSQFERIPVSAKRQEEFIQKQILDIADAIDEFEAQGGSRFTTKQMEKTKKSLEAKLEKLTSQERKDDVVTFEELGVDRLFVDESQNFKNLFLYTKMRNIAGIPQTDSQKSSDMFMKCRYMDELTGGKGVIFATGTPISNSMTELYTIMRYLQYDRLTDMSLQHFDAWASTFGETSTSIELAPEGSGYRARTRFSKFYNLPELMNVFKDVADIKTADTLNLPRPEAEFHNISLKPTEVQQALVKELSDRAAAVSAKAVEPNVDNMLLISTDGRKIGLDQRLMNPAYPDEPQSKVNACMENIHKIWEETRGERSAQLVFCDFSTPGKDKFNVYDDIKYKLLQKGIPETEIAYIHDADNEQKKKELFAKVRKGSVRILMGSTQKMGSGTNVQDKLIALHDLDCPWRPSDLEQRAGRIIRQGNENKLVHVYRYVTEGTFDSYLYQTLENKQKFISQIMTSKSPMRSCEDIDESVLSYAEVKALAAGNPEIREKMTLDVEVAKLKMAKSSHQNNIYTLQDKLNKHYPTSIKLVESSIERLQQDEKLAAKTKGEEFPGMEIMGKRYFKRDTAAEALHKLCSGIASFIPTDLGEYRGFEMSVKLSDLYKTPEVTLKGIFSHSVSLGDSPSGNITRLNNALDKIPERIEAQKERIESLRKQVKDAQEEIVRPFQKEDELNIKLSRLQELDISLNMDGKIRSEEQPEAVAAKSVPDERNYLIDSAKRKLGGNSFVMDAQKSRIYSGDVLEIGEKYAVQKISHSQGIIHNLNNNPELLEMIRAHGKDNICVTYDNIGKCSVATKESGQEQEAVSY